MQPKTSGAGGSRGSRAGRRYVAVGRPQERGPADGTLRHSPQASLIVLAPRPCPVPRAWWIVRPDPTDKPPLIDSAPASSLETSSSARNAALSPVGGEGCLRVIELFVSRVRAI